VKQPELLVEIARLLPHINFVVVGGCDAREQALFDQIELQTRGLRNVEFVGYVPYWNIDPYFDGAAVFLNTSESEGFPNTFLQAWSRGVPTVSFIDSGARENGRTIGRVVRDGHEMAEQVEILMRDTDRWAEESQRCLAYYEQHHQPEVAYLMYEEIFRELLRVGVPISSGGTRHEL
jgi:glycosyltransferase involved in cell wall biosynthesis